MTTKTAMKRANGVVVPSNALNNVEQHCRLIRSIVANLGYDSGDNSNCALAEAGYMTGVQAGLKRAGALLGDGRGTSAAATVAKVLDRDCKEIERNMKRYWQG